MNENNAVPHSIEPELQRPAPRALQRRGKSVRALGCIRLFILPHTIVGIGLLLFAIAITLVSFFGSSAPAQVTADDVRHGKNNTYRLFYAEGAAGQWHQNHRDVSRADFDATPIGSPVQVRRLPPLPTAQLVMPSGNRYPNPLFLWAMALFWDAIVSVFWYAAWIEPLQKKALVARGLATEGRITGKKTTRGRNATNYILSYLYAPREYSQGALEPLSFPTSNAFANTPGASRATPLQGSMNVTKDDYDAASESDLVTVLYNARKPKRSLIYRYADYQCVE